MEQQVQKVLWSGRLPKVFWFTSEKNTYGTNVACLRISLWFVGEPEVTISELSFARHRLKASYFAGIAFYGFRGFRRVPWSLRYDIH